MKIAHIINPVKVDKKRDLYYAQPITFESMRKARKFSKNRDIKQYAVFYMEDEEIVPDYFIKLPCLQESTLTGTGKFRVKRKLPYFKDILDALYMESEADYFIQTNADIGLMPHFYEFVHSMIKKGYESIIINKRIIPGFYKKVSDLPEMYSEPGGLHNGYDCFVFPREKYEQFVIGDVCMGTPWSESTLTVSMAAFCNLTVLRNAHATFHIGDSRTWLAPELADYRQHNAEEFAKVTMRLAENNPNLLKDPIIRWLIFKLKHELQESWSEDCHRACDATCGVR